MRLLTHALAGTLLIVAIGMGFSTVALSSADRTVYDKPEVRPGKVVKGKVMRVDEKSQ